MASPSIHVGCCRSSLQLSATSSSREPASAANSASTHKFHTFRPSSPAMRAVRCAINNASNTPSAAIAP